MMQMALRASKLANLHAWQPLGAVARGRMLERGSCQCRDVPADGNCLFTAIGRELAHKFPQHPGLPANSQNGQVWQQFLLDYIAGTADGTSVRDWVTLLTGKTIPEYIRTLAHADDSSTWGGFMEASLIVNSWTRRTGAQLACVLLRKCPDGDAQFFAWVGSREAGITIGAAWNGFHWVQARMTNAAWVQARAWALAP